MEASRVIWARASRESFTLREHSTTAMNPGEDTMTATIDTIDITAHTGLEVRDFAAYDFYKDVHKGIRSSLFQTAMAAGSVDPSDAEARGLVVEQVRAIAHLLDHHAEH